MGVYSDRVKNAHQAQHLSDADIRAAKCARSKIRNADRKAARVAAAEARNALTKPENRRDYRRKNGLKEFAKAA